MSTDHIARIEEHDVKVTDITLDYLITEEKVISPIEKSDYPLSIFGLNYQKISKDINKEEVETLFMKQGILTYDKLPEVTLINLNQLGLLDNNPNELYKDIKLLIQQMNQNIEEDKKRQKIFSKKWLQQFDINKEKYNLNQCNNKKSLLSMKLLEIRVSFKARKLKKLFDSEKFKDVSENDQNYYSKLVDTIRLNQSFIDQVLFKDKNINFDYKSIGIELKNNSSIQDLKKHLSSIYYVIHHYGMILKDLLNHAKKEKTKRLIDLFHINLEGLKKSLLNETYQENYLFSYQYNLAHFYDVVYENIIFQINHSIDRDISLRKKVDHVIQVTPNISSMLIFSVIIVMLLQFQFTLLKELDKRLQIYEWTALLGAMTVFSVINYLRNTIQFKRPNKAKYQKRFLLSHFTFYILIASWTFFYINRYDGYNDRYYYVHLDNEFIEIDGLVIKNKSEYTIPNEIDGFSVYKVNRGAFRGNRTVKIIDYSQSSAYLEESNYENLSSLEMVFLGNNIAIIPENAFKNTINLKYVELPTVIQKIEASAFYGTSKLKSIQLPQGLKTIENSAFEASMLTSIEIPDTVLSLGKDAFKNTMIQILSLSQNSSDQSLSHHFGDDVKKIRHINYTDAMTIPKSFCDGCENLEVIEIEGQINAIGENAFRDTLNLKNFIVPESVRSIGSNAFEYSGILEVNIPDSITFIGTNTFLNASFLRSIEFNASVNYIPDGFCDGCTSLNQFELNSEIILIGEYAFRNNYLLNRFDFVDSLEVIEKGAFESSGLNEINLSENINAIEDSAFRNVKITTLTISQNFWKEPLSFYFGDQVKKITKVTYFDVLYIPNNFCDNCEALTEFIIVGTPTSIGDYAFRNTLNLLMFTIPSSVESIGTGAFVNSINLESIDLPEKITSIPDLFCDGCLNLKDITMEGSIVSIGDYAFRKTLGLTSFEVPSSVTFIGKGAFESSRITKINIPSSVDEVGENAFKDTRIIEATLSQNGINKELFYYFGDRIQFFKHLTYLGVSSIPDNFCNGCISLNQITIEGNPTYVGENAFNNAYLLEQIELGNQVIRINDYAFRNTYSLKSIELHEGLETIGKGAFMNALSLTSLSIPKTVNNLGSEVLFGAQSITELEIPQYRWFLGTYKLDRYLDESVINQLVYLKLTNVSGLSTNDLRDLYKIKSIVIEGSIDEIKENTFRDMIYLESVIIPNSVKKIGSYAFANTSLNTFVLPENLTMVEAYVFFNTQTQIFNYENQAYKEDWNSKWNYRV